MNRYVLYLLTIQSYCVVAWAECGVLLFPQVDLGGGHADPPPQRANEPQAMPFDPVDFDDDIDDWEDNDDDVQEEVDANMEQANADHQAGDNEARNEPRNQNGQQGPQQANQGIPYLQT